MTNGDGPTPGGEWEEGMRCYYLVEFNTRGEDDNDEPRPFGVGWSDYVCPTLGGIGGTTSITLSGKLKLWCYCSTPKAQGTEGIDCLDGESSSGWGQSPEGVPSYRYKKCYDLGPCAEDVYGDVKDCGRFESDEVVIKVTIPDKDMEDAEAICACIEKAEDEASDDAPPHGNGCGIAPYEVWAAKGQCATDIRFEFNACLDRIRGDRRTTGSLPKGIENAIKDALDEKFEASSEEGKKKAKAYCKDDEVIEDDGDIKIWDRAIRGRRDAMYNQKHATQGSHGPIIPGDQYPYVPKPTNNPYVPYSPDWALSDGDNPSTPIPWIPVPYHPPGHQTDKRDCFKITQIVGKYKCVDPSTEEGQIGTRSDAAPPGKSLEICGKAHIYCKCYSRVARKGTSAPRTFSQPDKPGSIIIGSCVDGEQNFVFNSEVKVGPCTQYFAPEGNYGSGGHRSLCTLNVNVGFKESFELEELLEGVLKHRRSGAVDPNTGDPIPGTGTSTWYYQTPTDAYGTGDPDSQAGINERQAAVDCGADDTFGNGLMFVPTDAKDEFVKCMLENMCPDCDDGIPNVKNKPAVSTALALAGLAGKSQKYKCPDGPQADVDPEKDCTK